MSTSKKEKNLKVIVVGSCGVGKTALIQTYLRNEFPENISTTVTPASTSTDIKNSDGTITHLQIWDTAGQERYQSISKMFYRNANVALVCFQEETAETVEQWISRVRADVPGCTIFLVQTKADLMNNDKRMASNSRGNDLKRKYNAAAYFLTSSKIGLMINNVFNDASLVEVPDDAVAEQSVQETKQTEKSSCC